MSTFDAWTPGQKRAISKERGNPDVAGCMTFNPFRSAKRFLKPYSKAVGGSYRRWRHDLDGRAPERIRRRANKVLDYFDLYFMDHHFFRSIYSNRHQIAPGVWRSAQPSPAHIAWVAARGIKTVVNLRGERDCGSYRLEAEACERHGIRLINFQLQSRMVPQADVIRQARALFDEIEYPVLFHCKSGADRAGMMAALIMYMKEGQPIEQAAKQLSLKFGHIRSSETGVLDYLFERYLADNTEEPMTFFEWVETRYDPGEIKRNFKPSHWANFVVNRALQRE